MIKEIIKDDFLLMRKSEEATLQDLDAAQDLLDTLKYHREKLKECVGIAANMIGVYKRIIIVFDGNNYITMFNPVIIKHSQEYDIAEEGCLCHEGGREAKRYNKIKVQYRDSQFRMKMKTFDGYASIAIQHEIDHCDGILI